MANGLHDFFMEATEFTPETRLCVSGDISFKGKSYPENSFKFYQPVVEWLQQFLAQEELPPKIVFSFHLIYFNSSTAKQIFDLLSLLSDQYNRSEVIVRWLYDADNENALEEGEGLACDFPTLTFELVEIPA
jgi:hypothetical protein